MYRRILVVTGEHASSDVALAHALGLARALHAQLLAVHPQPQVMLAVADLPPVITLPADDLEREASKAASKRLDEVRAKVQAAGVTVETAMLESPDVADAVATMARERGCDLVVVGAEKGNALVRLLTGSPVPGLITRAAVPVMVCHADDGPPPPDDDA